MRKLLPYEHALIETLGITEEEYFAFRKAQAEYRDPKAGTVFDVRNGIEAGAVALVLSIVGTLASVGAALLAPRPEVPEISAGGGGRRARDKRFAPRIGFDSLQDLAEYGAPVNLVYGQRGTEKTSINDALANPDGGVRVNTSLLWSAVYSFGNAQYIQMMAAIGAGDIYEIDYDLTAVGQTLVRLFSNGKGSKTNQAAVWQYFRNSGPITKNDLKVGGSSDPLLSGVAGSRTVYDPLIDATVRSQGFSQAFSLPSSSEFGISSPVPIKVNVFARNEDGKPRKQKLKIRFNNRALWPDFYGSNRPLIAVGATSNIVIDRVKNKRSDNEADDLADEMRFAAAESFELGAIYKLGSAKFQVTNIAGDTDLTKSALTVTVECIEAGYGPWEDYETEDIKEQEQELRDQEKLYKDEIARLQGIRDNVKLTDFATDNLPARQAKAFEAIQNYTDQIEAIVDAVTGYRRNISELDELILEAEDIDTPFLPAEEKIFNRQVLTLANEVNRLEDYIEDQRDEIQGSSKGQKREYRLAIRNAKKALKKRRNELAEAVKEFGVKNGVVFDAMRGARELIRDVNDAMQGIVAVIPASIPDVSSSEKPRAGQERKKLKRLRSFLRRVESLVASALQFKTAEYDAYLASLDGYIRDNQAILAGIQEQLDDPNAWNDYLGTKCLTRVAEASYETLSPVNLVHFSIKARVFMRIQGRATKYGETNEKLFKDGDNGNKPRTAMFTVSYKKAGAAAAEWQSPNLIFCVRRSFDRDVFIPLTFRSPDKDGQAKWEFKFSPVHDPSSEALKRGALGRVNFVYLETRGPMQKIGDSPFYCRGHVRSPDTDNLPPKNKTPYGVDEWTIYSARGDTALQFSFDGGPEFRIVAVSEQQFENFSFYPSLYQNIATIGLNAYSGVGLTSMRNLSVFVNKGKKVRLIELSPPSYPSSPNGPSCFAPDIFLDTIVDDENGIRAFVDAVNEESIDITKLALSKAFCMKQRYFMDGVIASQGSWRAFWSEVAPYSLLELARIGGKETLIPAVPTLGDGTLTRNVTISALFNQGNILEDSYKEEFLDYGESTQDLIATIVYRDQSNNEPFPRNSSVTIKLKDTQESLASRQSFDLSNFVTNRNQALNYGMLLVQQRRLIRRAVEFKTFPTEAPVAPGSYIYVHMEENQWNDIHSGAVMDDGSLNIPFASEGINGTYDTLIYVPGRDVEKKSISYTNGQASALSVYKGTGALFVLGSQVSAKRVFRVVEVAMEEEGEVSIRAVEHPCEEQGGQARSLVVRFSESLYDIS